MSAAGRSSADGGERGRNGLHLAALSLLLAGIVSFLTVAGALQPFENALQNAGFAMRERPASGQLHIVEMDAASVAAIERWPWAREHYARVVDQLHRAGARTVAFDVDFSSPSNARQDAILAHSLAGSSSTIILPIFGQRESHDSARQLDSLPIAILRDYALLGSVSVAPDSDGLVRQMPLGTLNAGAPRPSLSAQIAHQSGAADTFFPIDFAIDPDTIPRHSFVAIERGIFDTAELRGKDVVIGATAIEMGDRYATPGHGILPGVVIQALAAETLSRGVPIRVGWYWPLALAALSSIWILLASSRASVAARAIVTAGSLLTLWHLGSWLFLMRIEIAAALFMLGAVTLLRSAVLLHREFEHARLIDAETGMPNLRALERNIGGGSGGHTVTAMIDEFDALKAVVGQAETANLLARIEDRLLVSGCEAPIYRVDDRVLAWVSKLPLYELENLLSGLAAVMRTPVEVAGRRVDLALGFGIAEETEISGAVHAASLALRSDDVWTYHEDAGKAALEQQISLMGELDLAIEQGELEVVYQPKLELAIDRITSAEALVRWRHPTRGYLSPDTFIPLAEESNRIGDLTLFVLQRAIDDLSEWCGHGVMIRTAVNISARLISSPDFVEQVERMIQTAGVPPDRLIFEITESATLRDPEGAREALLRFRDLGVAISMDDYGTGQSTLSYLKNLPLSELKIDRSFVQHSHQDPNDALLVRSTVELAHQMGLKVVAEGIEEAECLAFLRSIGCDYAQGYFIARPMKGEDLVKLVTGELEVAA
ncbi:EAL domain-containing protein [Roseibium sp.]|uniref:putative bifunctional diguanylate cyclase/phosphodiesterase n=1 Tax=Roseibium sp. TaxID=1936156 RepID=UPI0032997169